MPDKNAFQEFLHELGGVAHRLTSRTDIPPEVLAELDQKPKWYLLFVPDDSMPELKEYHSQSDFIAALAEAIDMELGHVFMFYGLRAYHAPGRFPHALLPNGKAVPLFDSSQSLLPETDGFVGNPDERGLSEAQAPAGDVDFDVVAQESADQNLMAQAEQDSLTDDYEDDDPGTIPEIDESQFSFYPAMGREESEEPPADVEEDIP